MSKLAPDELSYADGFRRGSVDGLREAASLLRKWCKGKPTEFQAEQFAAELTAFARKRLKAAHVRAMKVQEAKARASKSPARVRTVLDNERDCKLPLRDRGR